MAGMFDTPFVFDRGQILGPQYSPEALYPGMFGPGGMFARGGMFGPPQQTIRPKAPDITIPGWPDLGLIPLPSPGGPEVPPMSPPGLQPWEPLPPEAPVYAPPAPPVEPPAPEPEVPAGPRFGGPSVGGTEWRRTTDFPFPGTRAWERMNRNMK